MLWQGAVRSYTVRGSRQVLLSPTQRLSLSDLTFLTRSFEAIPGMPNSPFGPAAAGGDGTEGVLGPALLVQPGQRMSIFLQNNLHNTSALGTQPHG